MSEEESRDDNGQTPLQRWSSSSSTEIIPPLVFSHQVLCICYYFIVLCSMKVIRILHIFRCIFCFVSIQFNGGTYYQQKQMALWTWSTRSQTYWSWSQATSSGTSHLCLPGSSCSFISRSWV